MYSHGADDTLCFSRCNTSGVTLIWERMKQKHKTLALICYKNNMGKSCGALISICCRMMWVQRHNEVALTLLSANGNKVQRMRQEGVLLHGSVLLLRSWSSAIMRVTPVKNHQGKSEEFTALPRNPGTKLHGILHKTLTPASRRTDRSVFCALISK